ncbi:MAG: signal peptide peptidase SppA [Myxococcota bacterium]
MAACLVLVVAGVLLGAGVARAQGEGPFRQPTRSVATPAVSLAAPGDSVAVEVNPGALAFLEAWDLLYVHADARSDDRFAERGDAVYLGAPLPLGLALGMHVGSVRPTQGAGAFDRGVGTLALSMAPSSQFSIGTSLRFVRSDLFGNRHLGWDMAMNVRPTTRLALALIGRDLNALTDLTPSAAPVDASFLFAAAVRPFGSNVLTVEAAGGVDAGGQLGARGMVAVPVPKVGQLRGVVEVDDIRDDPDLRVTAGLDVRWGGLGVGGGVLTGDGFEDAPGWWLSARLSGARREGLPLRQYVLDVESRSELDERGILDLQRRLDRALHDPQVAGVLLRLRGSDIGLAHAQELRWLIARLEEAGKPVVCQLESATGAEYYACAEASRTLIDPAGAVRLMGPSIDVVLIGELLRNLGIRADLVRIGKYKSAPEQLTRSAPTEPAQAQREALLDDVWARLVADLASDLDRPRGDVEALIDRGPYAAPEAVRARMVAGTADDLDHKALAKKAFQDGHRVRSEPPTRAPERWGQPGRVGVVVVDGTLVDGENVDVPLLDIHLSGARTVTKAIDRLAKDPTVEAIVLRVDSPGGSALAADKIWRAVRAARRRKPVVASLGEVAASGGYYVASAADEIWADPSTVTGSIGIFFGKVDVAQLADRVGIHAEQLARGEHAGAQSIWRPYTDEEREVLREKIGIWYRMFLERVAAGRGMSVDDVDGVGQGRIWTGDAAVTAGLVDRLGGFAAALARARQLAGLPDEAGFHVVPFRPDTLLEHVFGREVGSGAARVRVPAAMRPALGLVATFGHSAAGVPLALSPHVFDVR